MPYVSASELVTFLPGVGTITATSTPLTIGEVGTICEQIAQQLDSVAIGRGYLVPISSSATGAFALMQLGNRQGAAWQVLRTVFPNMGGPGDRSSAAVEFREAYYDFLKALREGTHALIGIAYDQTAAQPAARQQAGRRSHHHDGSPILSYQGEHHANAYQCRGRRPALRLPARR